MNSNSNLNSTYDYTFTILSSVSRPPTVSSFYSLAEKLLVTEFGTRRFLHLLCGQASAVVSRNHKLSMDCSGKRDGEVETDRR